MIKNSVLRTMTIPLAAVAAIYGAVAFVGCGKSSSNSTPPPPPPAFKGNVFLDSLLTASLGAGNEKNYTFMHSSTSPDGTKMFVVFNESSAPMVVPPDTGTLLMYMLDAAELEKGNVKKLGEGTAAVAANATIAFRSNWTADGTKIVLGGRDRVLVIDATSPTLAVLQSLLIPEFTTSGVENHDALPTTDGAYAILTLNTGDGKIQLYDITNNALVGGSVSVCNACHGSTPPAGVVLCGIDGAVSKSGTTYGGTVYIAGHGGHIAKAALSIDPAAATPITVSTLDRIIISSQNFPVGGTASGRTHKLHDVRLSGSTIYWSTFNLDQNNQAHYGKINTDSSGLVDIPVNIDSRATAPAAAADATPIFCASGQTATAYFPTTMTNEAYISVIPKADVK